MWGSEERGCRGGSEERGCRVAKPAPRVVQFIAAHVGAITSRHGIGLSMPPLCPLCLLCLPWGITLEASVPLRDPLSSCPSEAPAAGQVACLRKTAVLASAFCSARSTPGLTQPPGSRTSNTVVPAGATCHLLQAQACLSISHPASSSHLPPHLPSHPIYFRSRFPIRLGNHVSVHWPTLFLPLECLSSHLCLSFSSPC